MYLTPTEHLRDPASNLRHSSHGEDSSQWKLAFCVTLGPLRLGGVELELARIPCPQVSSGGRELCRRVKRVTCSSDGGHVEDFRPRLANI